MIAPARQAAYEVLRAVNAGRADLPNALARVRNKLEDERDRALAGEITTGTLRWQGAFDHVISAFARRPAAKLDPEVLDILRLTAFQLLHLDRVPASAAVNDAVNLVKKAGKKSAAPLVNAVLRRISRERAKLPLPEKATERDAALDYLSITLSHPRWLVERYLDRYGLDGAEAWARFNNSPAALTLRVNTLRTTRDALVERLAEAGVIAEPTRFAPDGLLVRAGNPVTADLPAGDFFVQDEASQLIAQFAYARPGERILDLCASPGGKTTALAAAMHDDGLVVACDVRGRRVELLASTVATSGSSAIRVIQADASASLPFRGTFSCVLLDAPCSGLGTLRRDPDIRWRRKANELAGLAGAQFAMLNCAAAVVRDGGRLIYSTCSSEPEENELVVGRFLDAHPEFRLSAPETGSVARFMTPDGYFRTLPFRDYLEAFFAAMLVKTKDLQ